MDKFAQRRSILNKIREMTNISGIAAENFFKPDFDKIMAKLRMVDNNLRSIAAGESIGKEEDPVTKEKVAGDPGKHKVALKQLLKTAKSNLNRREYMQGVADLGRFHAKLDEMVTQIKGLDAKIGEVPDKFMYEHLVKGPDNETPQQYKERMEYLEYLRDLRTRLAAERQAALVKEAGIMDFFVNIGTKRGRALSAWEKRYPKHTEKLKKDSQTQLDASDAMLNLVLGTLKTLASARASRDVDAYMDNAKNIVIQYENYDKGFRKYYQENVKGFLEKMFTEPPPPEAPAPTPSGPAPTPPVPDLPVPTPPSGGAPAAPAPGQLSLVPPLPTGAPPGVTIQQVPDLNLPQAKPAPAAKPISVPELAVNPAVVGRPPANDNEPQMSLPFGKASHQKFYHTLQTMSNESPLILASFIKKYATKIQGSDPATSIKLFNIAKSIKG